MTTIPLNIHRIARIACLPIENLLATDSGLAMADLSEHARFLHIGNIGRQCATDNGDNYLGRCARFGLKSVRTRLIRDEGNSGRAATAGISAEIVGKALFGSG
jgi:hypothetical protein